MDRTIALVLPNMQITPIICEETGWYGEPLYTFYYPDTIPERKANKDAFNRLERLVNEGVVKRVLFSQ